MKTLIYRLLLISGVVAVMRFVHRNGLIILLYHGVAPKSGGTDIYNYRGKFVTPEAFDYQLQYLSRHYRILELDDALSRLRNGTLPKYSLTITFDDGYRNFYTHAYPILQRLGISATMFLATDFVLRKRPLWVDRLEYAIGRSVGSRAEKIARDSALRDELKTLSRDAREPRLQQIEKEAGASLEDFEGDRADYAPLSVFEIREMAANGMRFGAHTRSHPILSCERPEDAHAEITSSVAELQSIISPLSQAFAYPNGQRGDWRESEEEAVAASLCTAALTTIEGVSTAASHPYRMSRIAMDATDKNAAFASIASCVRLYLSKIKHRIYA